VKLRSDHPKAYLRKATAQTLVIIVSLNLLNLFLSKLFVPDDIPDCCCFQRLSLSEGRATQGWKTDWQTISVKVGEFEK